MKSKNAGVRGVEQQRGLVPRLRFPEFQDPWQPKDLSSFLKEHSQKVPSTTELPIYSSTRSGLKPQSDYFDGSELLNDGSYGLVPQEHFVYRHMSDDGIFKFNINKTGKEVAVSKEYPVFTTVGLDSDFLLHKLNYGSDFKSFALMQKKGGTRTRLYFSTLCSWRPFLPSFREQQKIGEVLSSIDELIAAEGRKLSALRDHKKGLLQQLFPAEGETIPRLRFPEFKNAENWQAAEVGDIFRITRGEVLSMTLVVEKRTVEKPYPVYSSQTKRSGLAGFYSDYLYEDAITWTTDGANAGDVNYRAGRFYCTNVCGVLISDKGYANPCVAALINSVAKGHVSYVGNPKLMNGVMARITISIPSLQEQQRIADLLSSVDKLITSQEQRVDTLKAHKKGLMQQLFPALDEVQA